MKSRTLYIGLAILSIVCLVCVIYPEYTLEILTLGALGMATNVAQGPITDRVRPYEFVRWEPNMLYNRTAGTIKNVSGGAILAGAIQCGLPLKLVGSQWQALAAGDEANVGGFFLGDDAYAIPEALANNGITAYKYPIFFRGPGLLNQSMISLTDLAGASYTIATIVSTMQAKSQAVDFLIEPTNVAVQNT